MNATTIATQVINQGLSRFGRLDAIDLPRGTWEQIMEEVASAGGEVGFDHCVVDGVAVRGGLADGDRRAALHVPGSTEPEYIDLAG